MSQEFTITIVIIVLGFAAILRLIHKQKEKPKEGELVLLQNQVQEIIRTLDLRLSESSRVIQQQFGQSAKIIADVTERLTKLDETNRQVISFTDQLRSLQDILKNPKQRGV